MFILAPMDDVTDAAFRQLVADCAKPDLMFTEFVNVDGLNSPGRQSLITKLYRLSYDPPLIAHIWGLKPDNFYLIAQQLVTGQIAKELKLTGQYAGVDLNMGCPVKKVVKIGACSGLILNQTKALEIIEATKSGLGNKLPLSIKTRLGYKEIQPEWLEFLLRQKPAMLTIHLRTVKELSKVPAHYDALNWIVSLRNKLSAQTKIIANGDIVSRAQGENIISQYKVDGVMIGRGIFNDPYVFSRQSQWNAQSKNKRIQIFLKHINFYENLDYIDTQKGLPKLVKFSKIYINNFNNAKEMRDELWKFKDIKAVKSYLLDNLE